MVHNPSKWFETVKFIPLIDKQTTLCQSSESFKGPVGFKDQWQHQLVSSCQKRIRELQKVTVQSCASDKHDGLVGGWANPSEQIWLIEPAIPKSLNIWEIYKCWKPPPSGWLMIHLIVDNHAPWWLMMLGDAWWGGSQITTRAQHTEDHYSRGVIMIAFPVTINHLRLWVKGPCYPNFG